MPTRRQVIVGLAAAAGLLVAGGGVATSSAFGAAVAAARKRIAAYNSTVIPSRFGPLEYGVAGTGRPFLMIHGTGGGVDQGLSFASRLVRLGYQVIAPSRFGYLRSSYPANPSSENQADAFVDLLDHLGVDRLPVAGGSAGALSAMQFAIRHPDRCSALIALVPAAYSPERATPEPLSPVQSYIINTVLRSDFLFWTMLETVPDQMIGTLLATDPELVQAAVPEERQRAHRILWDILPVSDRYNGLLNDAKLAGYPEQMDLASIRSATLTISLDDDHFGTVYAARHLAAKVPSAKLIVYPKGGHIWIGHDQEVWAAVDSFVRGLA
jgi:2-hydroxy-6-oxonona-2,4-dienedioate hydrolase